MADGETLFIVPTIDGALPPVARARLDAWRARGLTVDVFEWRGPASSGALTARLSDPVSHLAFSGLDDARLEALDRATGAWGMPVTVFFDAPPLPASRVADRVRSDARFAGVVRTDGGGLKGFRAVSLGSDDEVQLLERQWTRTVPPPQEFLLTVAVPAFNAGALLDRSIGSLLAAEAAGVEVLIVDDGSTDDTGTRAEALALAAPGLIRVIHQPNRGHGGAINTALAEAQGRYFRVLDADDRVEPLALRRLVGSLSSETVDLVLTQYAEVRPQEPLPRLVDLLGRLPHGAVGRVETLADPQLGVSSWAVILATSTFRTAKLREAKLRLTENSPYVDLEYVVLGLEHVETYRAWHDELYRYTLGADGQSVSEASYRRNVDKHEAVLLRLCEAMGSAATWSVGKRRYVIERVLEPIARRHLEVLEGLDGARPREALFRRRMSEYPFVRLPRREPTWQRLGRRLGRKLLPRPVRDALRRLREP